LPVTFPILPARQTEHDHVARRRVFADAEDDIRAAPGRRLNFHTEKPRAGQFLFHPICDFFKPSTGFFGSGNVQVTPRPHRWPLYTLVPDAVDL